MAENNNPAKIAVFGYGTVGSGIVEVIDRNGDIIAERIGRALIVKYILDLREFKGDKHEAQIVHDVDVILNDPEIEIVCEAMGGTGAAYKFTKEALLKGKSVCTSNKAVVAEFGPELLKLARDNGCSYLFEASCGGGIAVIRPIRTSLSPEKIISIEGILNGTTNYILTKIEKEGADFDSVLKEAQKLGYAEADPSADIEGYDACRKIAILSSLAYGKTVDFKEIPTEGITKITKDDFAYMKELDATIKLLGFSYEEDGKYFARVAPFVVPGHNPLFAVNDVMNAILIEGNTLGETMYYGAGAGKLPTASAVVSDVIECALHKGKSLPSPWRDEKLVLADEGSAKRKFFVRVKDEGDNTDFKIRDTFGDVRILNKMVEGEVGFVTGELSENDFKAKSDKLNAISYIRLV